MLKVNYPCIWNFIRTSLEWAEPTVNADEAPNVWYWLSSGMTEVIVTATSRGWNGREGSWNINLWKPVFSWGL